LISIELGRACLPRQARCRARQTGAPQFAKPQERGQPLAQRLAAYGQSDR
jgi:hypothetical protein